MNYMVISPNEVKFACFRRWIQERIGEVTFISRTRFKHGDNWFRMPLDEFALRGEQDFTAIILKGAEARFPPEFFVELKYRAAVIINFPEEYLK